MDIKPPIILILTLTFFLGCKYSRESSPQKSTNDSIQQMDSGTSFKDCPPEGLGGGNALLNRLKNRDKEPPSYESKTIEELITLRPQLIVAAGEKNRASWSQISLDEAAKYESRGIVVEGYLLKVKQSGVESCNCLRDDLRDWHVWIGPNKPADKEEAKLMRASGMIAEPTPRWLERKGWRLRQFDALARQHAKVRISGWMLWDQEHYEELPEKKGERATRGTLWEIHPMTKIEVFSGGKWIEFSGDKVAL